MSDNLVHFASIFKAFSCTLDFSSQSATIDVTETPRGKKSLVEATVSDIMKFQPIQNYSDGVAAIFLVDTIDGQINPIKELAKNQVLQNLGLKNKGLFIRPELQIIKNNRSWHISRIPNQCTYFGTECTHRPTRVNGKPSHKTPDQYHPLKKNLVMREQLVTKNLQSLFEQIPQENLTNERISNSIEPETLKRIYNLPLDSKLSSIEDLLRIA